MMLDTPVEKEKQGEFVKKEELPPREPLSFRVRSVTTEVVGCCSLVVLKLRNSAVPQFPCLHTQPSFLQD